MFEDFRISRKLLSSYYISIIFTFFILELISGRIISWSNSFSDFLSDKISWSFLQGSYLWLALLLISFAFVLLMRRFVVEPLGFYLNSEDGVNGTELTVLTLLVVGFLIFMMNQTFLVSMPNNWFPDWFIKLLGGYRNTTDAGNPDPLSGSWAITPWLWYLGPIFYMFFQTKVKLKD